MELADLAKKLKKDGIIHLKEGNGKVITFMKVDDWEPSKGKDWIFLIFELFQIRSICEPFSEVSLDIVEYASKPTIYYSPPNRFLKSVPLKDGNLQFSLIREPNWNKFLFQLSHPILVNLNSKEKAGEETTLVFPLFSPNVKEILLGSNGDIKIIKG